MMKKLLSVLAVVVASVTLAVPPAQATAHCVTKREVRLVHKGDSEAHVRLVFDTNGRVFKHRGLFTIRSYTPCRGLRGVSVTFKSGHLFNKTAIPR